MSNHLKARVTINIECEEATPMNDTPLMTNVISAGTPGTKDFTDMTNTYQEFVPGLKATHYKQHSKNISERLANAVWIARDVVKGICNRDA